MSKLQLVSTVLSGLGVAGDAVARCLVFSEDGRLAQFKVGKLAVWDRKRRDARRARRRARRIKGGE